MGERKVGDSENPCEPLFDGVIWNRVRQDHANPAAKILNASDAKVFQCPLDIAYEPLLEIFPVAAFEGEFVVVDDSAAHGLSSGMLKMADVSPAQPRRLLHPPALSLPIQPPCPGPRLSAGIVFGTTKSSTYPAWE